MPITSLPGYLSKAAEAIGMSCKQMMQVAHGLPLVERVTLAHIMTLSGSETTAERGKG